MRSIEPKDVAAKRDEVSDPAPRRTSRRMSIGAVLKKRADRRLAPDLNAPWD